MKLFSFSKSMLLMHKDIVVLKGKYDSQKHAFTNVEIVNATHLPFGCYEKKKFSLQQLNHWLYWRGIPNYRLGLSSLLQCLGEKSAHSLLEYSHHLSVSDTYWLKYEDETVTWDQVNYFHHSYDDTSFARASFANNTFHANESALYTPNNALNGFQRKAWMRKPDGLYLYKGGTAKYQEEPVNEWLASRICEVLQIPHVHYDVGVYEDKVVSICKNMCDEHTDLVPARDLLPFLDTKPNEFQLTGYQKFLQNRDIQDISERLDDLLLIDYLMLNTDRHNQNVGVLVDADTMEIKSAAPIFDTGTGLGALVSDDLVLSSASRNTARLFNAKEFSYQQLRSLILNLNRYDIRSLKVIPEEYGNMLVKYQPYTHMTNDRIEALYTLLYQQILSLLK